MDVIIEKSLEATLLRQLHLCGHIISHHTEESSSQRRLLGIIKKCGVVTQHELVGMMGIRPPSLSELVSKLEDKGYIVRKRDETHRRRLSVSITPQGEQALAEMQKEHERILMELFAALDEEERRDVSRLLKKLLDSWEPRHRELKKVYDAHEIENKAAAEEAIADEDEQPDE